MNIQAVRCRQCGGGVAMVLGSPLPSCLFCGAPAVDLVCYAPAEEVEQPRQFVPFEIESARAQAAFRTFATSSWWYPNDLRSADLQLRRLLLPAWAWSGRVETHWTGLVAASTASKKRPIAGKDEQDFAQILVPSSSSLSRTELRSLGPYDERAMAPFDPVRAKDPFELGELTRSAARKQAAGEMEKRHKAALKKSTGAITLQASSIQLRIEGDPVLVPVWIGAYRYGDEVYRVLVNGQTGQLWGTAPKSRAKQIFVVVLVLGLLFALVCCGGLGGAAVYFSR